MRQRPMFLEMIFKIVVVFDPEFSIRVYNKLHQLSLRIAYINLGIVPLATSAFFFMLTHCFPELIITFTLSALGVIFRDCLFFHLRCSRRCSRVNRCFFLVRERLGAMPVWRRLFHEGCLRIKSSIARLKPSMASIALCKSEKSY